VPAPRSVFHFDALRQFLLGFIPDPAWASWLVAQINTAFSMGCALNALMCASPELCGSECAARCASEGIPAGNATRAHVASAVLLALAEIVAAGPAQLEQPSGEGLLRLIDRAAAALGTQPRRAAAIAQSCAANNFVTFQALTGSGSGGRRRRLGAVDRMSPGGNGGPLDVGYEDAGPVPLQPEGTPAWRGKPTRPIWRPNWRNGTGGDGDSMGDSFGSGGALIGPLTEHAATVAGVCGVLQPYGGSCHVRLALILERLPALGAAAVALAEAALPGAAPAEAAAMAELDPTTVHNGSFVAAGMAEADSTSEWRPAWLPIFGAAALGCTGAVAIVLLLSAALAACGRRRRRARRHSRHDPGEKAVTEEDVEEEEEEDDDDDAEEDEEGNEADAESDMGGIPAHAMPCSTAPPSPGRRLNALLASRAQRHSHPARSASSVRFALDFAADDDGGGSGNVRASHGMPGAAVRPRRTDRRTQSDDGFQRKGAKAWAPVAQPQAPPPLKGGIMHEGAMVTCPWVPTPDRWRLTSPHTVAAPTAPTPPATISRAVPARGAPRAPTSTAPAAPAAPAPAMRPTLAPRGSRHSHPVRMPARPALAASPRPSHEHASRARRTDQRAQSHESYLRREIMRPPALSRSPSPSPSPERRRRGLDE
jgi:hypothetical protein